jgi:hypothetical protein
MAAAGERPTFELIPRGRELAPEPRMGALAQSGGRLVGTIVDGAVCSWLEQVGGQLVLIMWPREFRARFDPLELLDAEGRVLARGGDEVTVAGGYLKPGDPRSLGHALAFSAWEVSRAGEPAPSKG